jgi:hypothetical protein
MGFGADLQLTCDKLTTFRVADAPQIRNSNLYMS